MKNFKSNTDLRRWNFHDLKRKADLVESIVSDVKCEAGRLLALRFEWKKYLSKTTIWNTEQLHLLQWVWVRKTYSDVSFALAAIRAISEVSFWQSLLIKCFFLPWYLSPDAGQDDREIRAESRSFVTIWVWGGLFVALAWALRSFRLVKKKLFDVNFTKSHQIPINIGTTKKHWKCGKMKRNQKSKIGGTNKITIKIGNSIHYTICQFF